ncbi:MAG TPA: hypothetical protein VGF48_22305 [Thermoanaerobaculia bacterium]|jgi:hypothetical protein
MAKNEPLVSPHVDAAKALLEKVRALRAEIPRFQPEVPGESRKLATKTAVPDAFLESASVAIQVSERLAVAVGTNAATLRDSFGYALAYAALVQEFRALERSVAHTIRVERAEAASSALDIYAIARRLSKKKDGAELVPYVEDMRRKLRLTRRKANSTPAPAPELTAAPSRQV